MSFVIGLDLGTTGCKSIVFSYQGDMLGESYIEYALKTLSDKMIEQDPNEWWSLSLKAIKEAVSNSGVDRSQIAGISISSQGIAFLPVDENCNPLSNAISWLDTRAGEQAEKINSILGEDKIYSVTGKRISSAYVLPKILWIKENNPNLYKSTFKFLTAHDFILAKLTGELFTDHTLAGGTLLYDINKLSWSSVLAETFNVDTGKLPEIRWSGEAAGYLRKEIAEILGLGSRVTVCVGAQDQKAAAVGARLCKDTATVSLGTAAAIEMLSDKPVFDLLKRIPCFTYAEKGAWVLEAVVSTSGAALKWVRNTLFPDCGYQELDRMSEESRVGAQRVFFYPHLAGAYSPFWNSNTRAMFYGLSLDTSRADIIRAVLEGIAFQLKSNIRAAEEMGVRVDTVNVFGGGSKSKVWCKIIADILGKKLVAFESPEIANLGAGMLAARGCGLDAGEFGSRILKKNTIYQPDPECMLKYEDVYEEYIKHEKFIV